MIVDDDIKLTLAKGGSYGLGEFIGNKRCYVENGKMVVEYSTQTMLYKLENEYKIIRYHGYLENSSIILLDENENVLKEISSDNVIQDTEFDIPIECKMIYFSVSSDYSDYYYLQLFTSPYYDVTQYVDNWESLEVILSRDKTSGVISEVSFEFDFVSHAKELVKSIFEDTGLYSQVAFTIHKRGDFDNQYELVKELQLDFSTYQLTKDRVKISSANNTLSEIINSEGKTEYEIPVLEVADSKKWDYSRINFINNAVYQVPDEVKIEDRKVQGYMIPTIPTTSVELAPGAEFVDFVSQHLLFEDSIHDSFLFENVSDKDVNITFDIKTDLILEFRGKENPGVYESQQPTLDFIFGSESAWAGNFYYRPNSVTTNWDDGGYYNVKYTFKLDFKKVHTLNSKLRGQMRIYFPLEADKLTIRTENYDRFMIYFVGDNLEHKSIDVIKPESLLQRYLDEMSGVKGLYRGNIIWQEESYKTMIIAADSIRQMPDAKIYGKPNDFFDWMRVLGYEYEINNNLLTFKSRDSFFVKTVAMTMRADEVADLIEQADSEYAYTSVEIGYDKQDYDGLNGRLEPNGTFNYTTGYITREDNKLSLISPYRADSIGIEYLSQKDSSNTKDNEADNDIFFAALVEKDSVYEEYKEVTIQDEKYPLVLFNAVFMPCFLVKRNLSLIGINAKVLKFKSSDMSSTATIQGYNISPYGDVEVNEKIFEPIIYNFAAGSHKDMPKAEVRNGLVKFIWDGEEYTGFIKEIRKNYAKETETTWELYAYKEKQIGSFSVTPEFVWISPNEPKVFTVVSDSDWVIE